MSETLSYDKLKAQMLNNEIKESVNADSIVSYDDLMSQVKSDSVNVKSEDKNTGILSYEELMNSVQGDSRKSQEQKPETIRLPSESKFNDGDFGLGHISTPEAPQSTGAISGAYRAAKLAYRIADLGTIRGKLAWKQAEGLASDTDLQALNKVENEIKHLIGESQKDHYIASSIGMVLPYLKESAIKGGKGALIGGTAAGVMALIAGQLGPQIATPEEFVTVPAMTALGAKIGASFFSLDNMRQIETGSVYRDLLQSGVDPGVSYVAANGYGMISTGLEAGALKILTKMLPGSQHIAKNAITKALQKTIGTRIASGITHVALGEAGVETTQQFTQNLIEEVARISNDSLQGTKLSQSEKEGWISVLTKDLADTFARTSIGFGVTAIPGVSIKQIVDSRLGIGDAKKDTVYPEVELDKTYSKKKDSKVRQPIEESKPTPVKNKITPPVVEPPVIKPDVIDIKVYDTDGSETTNEGFKPISLTENDFSSPEEFKSWKYNGDPKIMARIIGEKMAEGADKIKVQSKDLRQPAIMLHDGSIIKGHAVGNWSISNPGDSAKEIPSSWRSAREVARSNGFDVEESTEGFIAKGKFVNKQQALEKLNLTEKVNKVNQDTAKAVTYYENNPDLSPSEIAKKAGVTKRVAEHARSVYLDLKEFTGEATNEKVAADLERIQSLRKATQEDRLAVTKIKQDKKGNVIKKVVNRLVNTSLGKHFDKTELTAVAQSALWEFIRKTDPKEIGEFIEQGGKGPFKGKAFSAMKFALLNFTKESLGQGVGMNRGQVEAALKEGTFFSPLAIDEALIASPEDTDVAAKEKDFSKVIGEEGLESGKKTSIVDKQIKEDVVSDEDRKPSEIKKVSVEQYLKEKAAEEARKESAKEKLAAQASGRKIAQTIKEDVADQERLRELQQKEREAKARLVKEESKPTKPVETKKSKKVIHYGNKKVTSPGYTSIKQRLLSDRSKRGDLLSMLGTHTTTEENENNIKQFGSVKTELKTPQNPYFLGNENNIDEVAKDLVGESLDVRTKTKNDVANLAQQIQNHLQKLGYDGIEYINTKDSNNKFTSYVLFPEDKPKTPVSPQEKLAKAATKQKTPGARKAKTLEQRIKMREAMRKRMSSKWSKEALEKFDRETEAMMEQATKPKNLTDEVSNADKTMLKKLTEEKGESPEIRSSAALLHKTFSKVLDMSKSATTKTLKALDVEWYWKNKGAHETGFRLKNIFSRQDAEERLAMRHLNDFKNKIRDGFGKTRVTRDDLAHIVLATELPEVLTKFDEEYQAKIKPAIEWLTQYFQDSQQRLKDRGINVDYKQRMLSDLKEQIKLLETDPAQREKYGDKYQEKLDKLSKLQKDISNMQFVHIPLKMWFDTQVKKAKKQLFASDIGGYNKAKAKLEILTARKRRGSLINNMLDKEILDKADINPVEIILNYARRFGHDMALADIRDAAEKEGLIKVAKGKPKKGNWVKMPKNLSALQVFTPEGKNSYIDTTLMNYINDSMTAKFSGNWFTKSLSIIKMAQFYNPLILPMYDVFQSAMATLPYMGFYPKAGWKTMNDIFYKTEDYYNVLRNGLASKPFAMPFTQWVRQADIKTYEAMGSNPVTAWLKAYGQEFKKAPITTAAKTIYIASWEAAWSMDEYVRLFTANVLKEAGMNTKEAAQTAAKFHGDYASVPSKTRRVLNYTFFTPTFKIAMGKLYWSMLHSTITNITNPKEKTLHRTVYAQGLLALIALDIAKDVFLKSLGFEEDKLFRRYKKLIYTDKGPKELVITLSDPANLPFKLYYQALEPMIDYFTKANKPLIATSLKYAFQYEIHPAWQTALRFFENKRRGGEPIVSEFDNLDTRAKKYGWFIMEEFYTALPGFMNILSGEDVNSESRKEAQDALKRDYGRLINMYFDWLTFAYTRNTAEIKGFKNLERLKRELGWQMQDYFDKEGKVNQEWIDSYEKKIEETTDELTKYRK